MSAVTFVADGDKTIGDWPEQLVGDGFIHVDYYDAPDSTGTTAIYRDQFGEDIEIARVGELLVGDVRED